MSRETLIILSVKPDGLPLAKQHQLQSTLEIKSVHHEKKTTCEIQWQSVITAVV